MPARSGRSSRRGARNRQEVKRKAGVAPEPRRWPWLLLALAIGAGVFVAAPPQEERHWTPAPAGDGPVPSYREDPVPSSPSDSGKTVSAVPDAAGDATPPDTDLGVQTAQLAEGDTGTEEGAGAPASRWSDRRRRRPRRRPAGINDGLIPHPPAAPPPRSSRRGPSRAAGTVEFMSEPVVTDACHGLPARAARPQAAPPRGPQQPDPDRAQAGVDQDPAKMGPEYTQLKGLVRREGLHTVCEEAGCPNIYECWEDREATFLIGGDQCTRRCDFCQIDTGKPAEFDADEPRRVAESVATMGLRYATITGVARDDLPDGGAWLYAETVRQIHASCPAAASSC